MKTVGVEQWDISYQQVNPAGARGCLLFIHGSGADHSTWREQMSQLPHGYQAVLLDLPGHGQSSGPLVGSITACARLVDKFLGCLALPRPLIAVGHSMGAAIALTLALNHADHVDGLVLVGAGARMRVLPAFLDALGKGQSNPDFIRLAFSPHTSADIVNTEVASFSAVDTAVLFNDFSACNSFDISSRLTAINLPTLILVGEDDRLTPVKYSHSLNENISGAQLLIIPQAGHMAMLEKGAEVSKAIKEFTDRW